VSYAGFTIGLIVVGWLTFKGLKFFENRKPKIEMAMNQKVR